jgi:hypothetical protein
MVFSSFFLWKLHPVDPGKFTQRAYVNGKLSLVKFKAFLDLIVLDTSLQSDRYCNSLMAGSADCIRDGGWSLFMDLRTLRQSSTLAMTRPCWTMKTTGWVVRLIVKTRGWACVVPYNRACLHCTYIWIVAYQTPCKGSYCGTDCKWPSWVGQTGASWACWTYLYKTFLGNGWQQWMHTT